MRLRVHIPSLISMGREGPGLNRLLAIGADVSVAAHMEERERLDREKERKAIGPEFRVHPF